MPGTDVLRTSCVVRWLTLRASCPMRATVEARAAAGLWLLLSGRPKYCASAITVVWPSVTCTCSWWLLLVSKTLMRSDCLRIVMRSQVGVSGHECMLCVLLGSSEGTSRRTLYHMEQAADAHNV